MSAFGAIPYAFPWGKVLVAKSCRQGKGPSIGSRIEVDGDAEEQLRYQHGEKLATPSWDWHVH
jgi:hypothetical protein